MENLVIERNGKAITTSLLVAEKFGKEHRNVLDSIRNILAAENSAAKFFQSATFENRGKNYPMFYMNRDGFSLLVMGFTGEKAMSFKVAYIRQFNAMEEVIRYRVMSELPDFTKPAVAARAWADQFEGRVLAENKLQLVENALRTQAPKAEMFERVMETDGLVDIGQVAKILHLPYGRNKLFELLREQGVFFKNRNEPKQEYIDRDLFRIKEMVIERKNHPPIIHLKVFATQKGLMRISQKFGGVMVNNSQISTLS